jgi:putative oxidoreductase
MGELYILKKKMKEKIMTIHRSFTNKMEMAKDLPLLAIRIVLAYGFWGPATMKWNNIDGIIQWFEGMNMPFPTLNAYMATATEMAGVFLLLSGLLTRLISIPLMVVMLVAIFTVHYSNGFEAGENGFEIPLYYLIMLFTLLVYGGGRLSLDNIIKRATKMV